MPGQLFSDKSDGLVSSAGSCLGAQGWNPGTDNAPATLTKTEVFGPAVFQMKLSDLRF